MKCQGFIALYAVLAFFATTLSSCRGKSVNPAIASKAAHDLYDWATEEHKDCSACDGSGKVTNVYYDEYGNIYTKDVNCAYCNGKGYNVVK